MASIFGKLFTVSSWGESHGLSLGAVIDGCPAGMELDVERDIQPFLDRRKPGQSSLTTQRKEEDKAEILSGVFEGKTTGTPISILIKNADHRSADYSDMALWYRPGHADEVYDGKYGFRDYRGGGRSSARETAARVVAGSIARKILKEKCGTEFTAWVSRVGNVGATLRGCPLQDITDEMQAAIENARKNGDSIGGIVSLSIKSPPKFIGEPVFDRAEALLAMAMLSIPATKGFEIGEGFAAAGFAGSEHNKLGENHAGGVYGGITSGEDIFCRIAFKPTPSIAQQQEALNRKGEKGTLAIKGRHDPCVAVRAPVIVESMAALVLVDLFLQHRARGCFNCDKIS